MRSAACLLLFRDLVAEDGSPERVWLPLAGAQAGVPGGVGVMVRRALPPRTPPPRRPSTAGTPPLRWARGVRVEAFWRDAWWMGTVGRLSSIAGKVNVEFDPPPLGEGDWMDVDPTSLRPGHPQEGAWFGMLEEAP